MKSHLIALLHSLVFFTRLPIPWTLPILKRPSLILNYFSLMGLVLGLLLGALGHTIIPHFNFELVITLILVLSLLLTGAFHEDGLADFFDALAARSRSHFLEISKDPRIGSYGVLALVGSFILKILLYREIGSENFIETLILVYVLSRSLTCFLIYQNRNIAAVSKTGDLVNNFDFVGLLINLIPLIGVMLYFLTFSEMVMIVPSVLILFVFRWKMKSMLGGITGDVIGAAQQIMELSLLLTLALI
ncbi:MAG: adenosylcobinamide-GDP ribazoletransferase [Bacteriovoracaceae bacterium]